MTDLTDPQFGLVIAVWLALLFMYWRGRSGRHLRNKLHWSISSDDLPMTLEKKGHEIAAWIWILISGVPLIFILTGLRLGGLGGMVISLVFGAPLLIPVALFSINQFFLRKRIEVTHDEVRFEFRDLLRKRKWTEPLANYTGVRLALVYGRDLSSPRWHMELAHADPGKAIILFDPGEFHKFSRKSKETEAELVRLSTLLRKPILEEVKYRPKLTDIGRMFGNLTNH